MEADGGTPTIVTQTNPANAGSEAGHNERIVPNAKTFTQVIQASTLAPTSSAACRKYCEELRKACERLGLRVESVITGTVDAQVVYDTTSQYGIIIIFAGPTGIAKRPVSDKAEEVSTAFKQRDGMKNMQILKCFVVEESSYEYSETMAVAIYNTIRTVIDEDNGYLTVNSFAVGGKMQSLIVSTKTDAYRDYIRRVSPFGFSERDDIGFLVGFPRENCPLTDRFNVSPETHYVLFAVTGYTQFTRIDNPVVPYLHNGQVPKTIRPIVHITSIVSQTPSLVLLPAAITIAAKVFIGHRNWRKPYLIINGKESMNVGNLVLNVDPATGARSTVDAETAFQAEEAMNAVCDEPVLVLDITQGRDSIPGMESILGVVNGAGQTINLSKALIKFFPGQITNDDININASAGQLFEYTGSVLLDNQVVDSRCADYLRMFRKIGDYGQVATLLVQPNDPALRLQQLQDFGLVAKSLYNTTGVILSYKFVELMCKLCPGFEVDLSTDTRFNYAFTGIEAATGLAGLSMPVGGGNNGFNNGFNVPFTRWK